MTKHEPLTEAQIIAGTVGERRRHDGSVTLVEYDPAWPVQYRHEDVRIRGALGERVKLLEHVGSTSVPGLAAKPVIDMLLVVASSADEPAYVPALEAVGYVLRIREPAWHEHRLLKGPDAPAKLHVFSEGCAEIERMLLFRDRVRSVPDERLLYERTKRELAQRVWAYVQNYADAKSEVVEGIIARARVERR